MYRRGGALLGFARRGLWLAGCPAKQRIDGVAGGLPSLTVAGLDGPAVNRPRAREHTPPAIRWGLCSDARIPGTTAQPPSESTEVCALVTAKATRPHFHCPPFAKQTASERPRWASQHLGVSAA